jgi:hypothetical protein
MLGLSSLKFSLKSVESPVVRTDSRLTSELLLLNDALSASPPVGTYFFLNVV